MSLEWNKTAAPAHPQFDRLIILDPKDYDEDFDAALVTLRGKKVLILNATLSPELQEEAKRGLFASLE